MRYPTTILTPEQYVEFLIKRITPSFKAIVGGYIYDPGDSDLDDQQPISVRMTLGDYRRATHLLHELSRD